MKNNLKIFAIVISFVMLVSVACGATPTPAPTATEIPTQTPYPTYTSAPTYTSVPTYTPVPPTATSLPLPTNTSVPIANYEEMDCPPSITIPAGLTAKCFALNMSPAAVGLTFYSNGELVAINVTWARSAPESVTRKAATFVVMEAQSGGWNLNDVQTITERLTNTPADKTIVEGTIQAVWSQSSEFTTITYGLISFFGG